VTIKAVVLAAGKGERLKAVLNAVPKPMVQMNGKPMLEHNIEWLRDYGIKDIYMNLHHLPDVIRDYFGAGERFGVRITYSYEDQLLGTAGAVRKIASEYWGDEASRAFLVVYGDNLLSGFDLAGLITFHEARDGVATICLYRKPEEVSKSGVVLLDSHSRVLKFLEKPRPWEVQSDLVNTGIYVLEPAILSYIAPGCLSDFGKDVFPAAIDAGESIFGLVANADLVAIDTPELYKKALGSRR
jgi:NDP-sugar pyrophosphorylase family protein